MWVLYTGQIKDASDNQSEDLSTVQSDSGE